MNANDLIWIGFILLDSVVTAFGFRSLRADRTTLASGLRVPGVVARLRQDSVYSDVMVAGAP